MSLALVLGISWLLRGEPDWVFTAALTADTPERPVEEGCTRRQALGQPAFYLMLAGLFVLVVACMGVQPYLVPYLTSLGYAPMFASLVTSVLLTWVIGGKVLLGMLFDSSGPGRAALLSGGLMLISAALLLVLGAGLWAVWLFVAVYGVAYALMSIPSTYFTVALFGVRDFPSIFAVVMVVTSLAGSVGNLVTGQLSEHAGGYSAAWMLYAGLSILAAALLLLASRRVKPAQPGA